MKRKKRRARLSFGTAFMLLLTLLVVLGCAWFMSAILGEERVRHAAQAIEALTFAKEEPVQAYTAAMTDVPSPAQEASLMPSATASPAPTATPMPEKATITIAAAGSVYAPKAILQTVEDGGEADFTPVFAPLGHVLADADLAIVTLETTTAGGEKGYDNYNTPPEILDALRSCGVDLISLGTEHALDMGYEGLAITLQEISRRGLSSAGVHVDGQDSSAAVMRIGGVQVAVLAYSYGLSEEGREKTGGDSLGQLALMDMDTMRRDISAVRAQGANIVIVLPHWGTKNKLATPETVREAAQELAKAGADVILGTHPNVAQGVERIAAVRGDGLVYETLVCYSLGSLLTDARTEENTAGMAVSLSITYDPVSRRAELGSEQVTPLYIARAKPADKTVYRIVPAQDEEALARLDEEERAAAQRAAQIVDEAIGQEDEP